MTSLNLSSNELWQLVLPAGWTTKDGRDWTIYKHSDGREQKRHPGEREGIVAIANAIKDMGALTTLMFGDKQPVTMTTEMTEADFGGKVMSCGWWWEIVAAFLPKCT
jgi:hypothetical protein